MVLVKEVIEHLIQFAKENYVTFKPLPDDYLRAMFETYKNTTIVNIVDDKIRGFGIYQEWPDLLNFICIVGNPENDVLQNVAAMMDAKDKIPANKKIVYFDESKMELRICRQPQLVG